jgi:hypothetical protein
MGLFTSYVFVAGSLSASAQIARGLVRGAGKLVQGDPKGALVEAAGGVIAPATSAVSQLFKLGSEVFEVASNLIGAEEKGDSSGCVAA